MTALLEALTEPLDTVLTLPFRLLSLGGYMAWAADRRKAAEIVRRHRLQARPGDQATAVHLYGPRRACYQAYEDWQRWEAERQP